MKILLKSWSSAKSEDLLTESPLRPFVVDGFPVDYINDTLRLILYDYGHLNRSSGHTKLCHLHRRQQTCPVLVFSAIHRTYLAGHAR